MLLAAAACALQVSWGLMIKNCSSSLRAKKAFKNLSYINNKLPAGHNSFVVVVAVVATTKEFHNSLSSQHTKQCNQPAIVVQ